jgi:hypothetical protein
MSWLDTIVRAHQFAETPARYYYWAGLAAIAATVRKRVWLDKHIYKLFPNIYVMLVSEKSGLRKGPAISLVKSLLNEVKNTRVVAGRNSIQGIIKEFSTQVTLENGVVLSDAQGILLSDEFAAFIIDDPGALTILTGLHNTHEHSDSWRNTLKGSPTEELKHPCINLLAASNERLFDEVIKNRDMEGGFIARTFLVYESKAQCINSLVDKPEGLVPLKVLSERLKEIAKLEGEFKWTERGKTEYNRWYVDIRGKDFDDKTGSVERLGDQVLKASMLLSLAYEDSLELSKHIIEEAIEKCEECITSGTAKMSHGIGAAPDMSVAVKKLLGLFERAPNLEISRVKLLKQMFPILADVVDRLLDTLLQHNGLEMRKDKSIPGHTVYKLTESAFAHYKAYQKGA